MPSRPSRSADVPRARRKTLILAVVGLIAAQLVLVDSVDAYQVPGPGARPWTGNNAARASTTLPSGVTATVSAEEPTYIFATNETQASVQAASGMFDPPISTATRGLRMRTRFTGCSAGTATCNNRGTVTVSFSEPVRNPVLYASGWGGTSTRGNPVSRATVVHAQMTLVSSTPPGATLGPLSAGATNMAVSGSLWTSASNLTNVDCVNTNPPAGAIETAACGSVRINGTVTSVTFDVTAETTATVGVGVPSIETLGDQWVLTVSADEDFGDAPASYDGATAASHMVGDLTIGAGITADNTTTPNPGSVSSSPNAGPGATGDTDDGVTLPPLTTNLIGSPYSVPIALSGASRAGRACGWIDFDLDGSFATSERTCRNFGAGDSSVTLPFSVPTTTTAGPTYARFRVGYTNNQVQSPAGLADSGEVEDYLLHIKPVVRVLKTLDPTGDPGLFDLTVDGTTFAADVGDGGDTGFVSVYYTDSPDVPSANITDGPVTVTLAESAGTGTTLADYTSTFVCVNGLGTTVASGTGTTTDVTLPQSAVDNGQEQNIACLYLNLLPTPSISVEKNGALADTNGDGVDSEGDVVTYTFTVENTGNVTLDPVVVTDPLPGLSAISCPATSLTRGASMDCTASYVVTQSDVDAGSVDNTVTATGTPPSGPDVSGSDNESITLTADPTIALTKTGSLADTNGDGVESEGDVITYTFDVENTGNVTLTSVGVTDPLSGLSAITCPTTTLTPSNSVSCTATYTATQADVDSGSVDNTATTTGTPPTGTAVTDTDSESVTLIADPSIALVKTGSLADTNGDGIDSAGDIVTYTFTVENTGNVTLNPIGVADPLPGLSAITCPTTTLTPDDDTDCTATYTLTQTDLDAGQVDNTATAGGFPPIGAPVTDTDTEAVTLTADPAITLDKVGSWADTNGDGTASPGDVVTYAFTVENTGNVTLDPITVTDPLPGLSAITCPVSSLAPGADTDCTATYTLTQTDVDAGSVINTATATGTPPSGPDVTDTDPATVDLTPDPELALAKTGSLADTNGDGIDSAGDIVTYTLTVENTGNVTLNPIGVADPLPGLSAITCPTTTLAPGDDTDCTATYTLTQTDLDNGQVDNTATATGTPPSGPDVTDTDTDTITLTPNPAISVIKTGTLADTDGDGVDSEGDIVTYTFTVENTGNVTLNPIGVADPLPGLSAITCPTTTLAPGADTDCTATYTLTQTDVDNGQVDNTATATGTPPSGPDATDTDTDTVTVTPAAQITLDKTGSLADTDGDGVDSEGDIVTYTFTVENTGNVTLDPITVTDPLPGLSAITCPTTTLAPGDDTDCTATYTLTQTDLDNGQVDNTATATGTPPSGPDVTDTDTDTITLTPDPELALDKVGSLADADGDGVDSEGDIVTYTFTVENTGNVTLDPIAVTDPLTGLSAITCPVSSLAPGADTDCTATYTLTQSDVDAGSVINTATATGTPPSGPDVTDTDSETVTLVADPAITLDKTGAPADTNGDGVDSEGDIVTYTFSLRNNGNVTLTTVDVTDPLPGLTPITCPTTTLAPGDDTDCTATYTLTQTDVDAGSVINTATATGTPPSGADVSDSDDETVTLVADPDVSLVKTGSLADTNGDGANSAGDIVTYAFTVENTGSTTLNSVAVVDPLNGLSAITCPTTTLAPGDDTDCTATYTLTQTDLDNGSVDNTATATGTPPTGPDATDTDTETVTLTADPAITLDKVGSLADTDGDGIDSAGDIVTYTLTVENTGNVTLNPIGVADPLPGLSAITCPTTTLAPGDDTDCTATYTLTQTDLDNGSVDNTATATGTPPTGPDATDTDSTTVTVTPAAQITLDKTGSLADTNGDGIDSAGDIVTYTLTVENTGNVTLDPITVTDPLPGLSAITCPTTTLAPGDDTDCTATYTLTQTDVDAGSVINTATATGTPPSGPDVTDTDPATVDLTPDAAVALAKAGSLADADGDGVDSEGDIVTYTLTVENTGNVTLDPIAVTDPLTGLSAITCPVSSLAPGADTDCTATYTLTQSDVDAGSVINTATATGTPPSGPDVTDTDSETVTLVADPAITLDKTGAPADTNGDGVDSEGDIVTYTFSLRNNGNVTLTTVDVTDPLPGLTPITCPTTTLAPGDDTDCTATYTLTQTDVDAGSVINTATATGTPPSGADVSDSDDETVTLVADPDVSLVKTGSLADTNGDGADSAGDIVTYAFTVENTGSTTLNSVAVVDPLNGLSAITCPTTTLAPGDDTDCTATYTLTQTDLDAGSVINTATATGTPPSGPDVTDTDPATVDLTPDPELTLDKTGSLADTNGDGIDSAGDIVTYTLTVENTGNVTLNPIGVADPLPGLSAITCPTTTLAPGDDTDCTATYTLTQTDIDNGQVDNTATATGTPPTGPDATDTDSTTVTVTPAAQITLDKTGSLADTNGDGIDSAGDIVTYTLTVENTGNVTLNPIGVADPLPGLSAITCPTTTLAPGDDTDCTATYTLTQTDIDNGQVDNTATATGTPPTGPDATDTDSTTVTVTPAAQITLDKTGSLADTNGDGVDSEGDIVTYTLTVENTGNVTLNPIGVADPLPGLSAITCPTTTLAPGDDTDCTATYTLTQTDIDNGQVDNTATATGTPPTGPPVTDTDPATVDLGADAAITLTKTGSLADTNSDSVDSAGDTITYTFAVENTGNVTLTSVGVTDPLTGLSAITCPTTTLAPGDDVDCGATYTLTQTDIDDGQVDNTATASGTPPTGPPVTDTDPATVDLGADAAITLTKTGSLADTNSDSVDSPGDLITYTFAVENTGNVTLTSVGVTDPLTGLSAITCSATSLVPGASTSCGATYSLTQTDIDAGSVINTATASGTPPTGPDVTDTDSESIPLTAEPAITLTKTGSLADTNSDSVDSPGDVITYTFAVENTGNVTLDPIAVTDPLTGLSGITCPATSLAPGADTDCTATYTLTQTDIDNGQVDNTATATGTSPTGPDVTDTDPATVDLGADPAITLTKTGSLADTNGDSVDSPGDVITYTFAVENTGNVTLDPIAVTDPLTGLSAITCPTTTLAPGASTDCTATYTLTQTDIDDGQVDNTATASGTPPTGPDVTDPDPESIPLTPAPDITLTKTGSLADTNSDSVDSAGDVITYTFAVENTGNVTLDPIAVTDPLTGLSAITCPATSLAPGADTDCTATYTLTQTDIDAGSVLNTATATGSPPSGPSVEDNDSTTVTLDPRSVIGLAKALGGVTNNGDGTSRVALLLTVENLGATALTDLVVTDDVIGQFAGLDPRGFDATDGSLTASTTWDGAATTNVLATGQSLDPGETGTVFIAFTVTPGDVTSRTNMATSSGLDPLDQPVTDASTDGTDPDPNGDGDPDEAVPTVVPFDEHPQIGAAKRVAAGPDSVPGGGQAVTYGVVVANVGDVSLSDVQAVEDLSTTFAGVMSFRVDRLTSDELTVNPAYDGKGDIDLLTGTDTLAVGESGIIELRVVVVPGVNRGPFENQVVVTGTSPAGRTVTDTSTDGSDIDPDGDGNPRNDSDPTSVSFGTSVSPTPPPVATSRPSAPLPATGQDSATAAQLAAALIAVGAVMMFAGRRRRRDLVDPGRS